MAASLLRAMLLCAILCALPVNVAAFQPLSSGALRTPLVTTKRARPTVAIVDDTLLNTISSAIASSSSALPPGFEGFAPQSSEHKFSHYFMLATGSYILGGALQMIFMSILRATGLAPSLSSRDIAAYLADAPQSTFGWLQADLRTPLPPLEELQVHPIGLRDGKQVFLCTAAEAIKYRAVEVSRDFSEHYGQSVYICQEV